MLDFRVDHYYFASLRELSVRSIMWANSTSSVTICALLLQHAVALSSAWSLERQWGPSSPKNEAFSRRDWLFQMATIASASTMAFQPTNSARAAEEQGLMSADTVADMLHSVPTFTIVDASGVPYMVVGEDAKVTGYFFTDFAEADRILLLAKTSADRAIRLAKQAKEPVDDNPWKKARISTVPLDFAVTLVSKSRYTKNYFQVAPSQDDVEDALAITGKKDLAEGKVPLFYMKDFLLEDPTDKSKTKSPLYFRKSELVQAFKRQNKKEKEIPEVLVTELFAVLLEMVKPGGTDEELKSLVIVPPKGSDQKAKQCIKAGGSEPPFALGKRNLVL